MSKGCTRKTGKERITFNKTAVIKNSKIKNAHAEHYITWTDIIEGAVSEGAAEEFFIWKINVWK